MKLADYGATLRVHYGIWASHRIPPHPFWKPYMLVRENRACEVLSIDIHKKSAMYVSFKAMRDDMVQACANGIGTQKVYSGRMNIRSDIRPGILDVILQLRRNMPNHFDTPSMRYIYNLLLENGVEHTSDFASEARWIHKRWAVRDGKANESK